MPVRLSKWFSALTLLIAAIWLQGTPARALADDLQSADDDSTPTLLAAAPGTSVTLSLRPFTLLKPLAEDPLPSELVASYDENELHLGIKAGGRSRHLLKAEQRGRDSRVWEDDCIEVFLAPGEDPTTYWHLAVNPNGALFDQYCSGGRRDGGKNLAGVRVSMMYGEDWWRAAVSIPWSSLGGQIPQEGTRWRLNVTRTVPGDAGWESYVYSSWAVVPGGGFHSPIHFGFLEFGAWHDALQPAEERPEDQPASPQGPGEPQ